MYNNKLITVFLPCRKGSQRINNKNIREFAEVKGGLLRIKLEQLLKSKYIDNIILSTNDNSVIDIAQQYFPQNQRLITDNRPDSLANSQTSTDDLINYASSLINKDVVIWTHVTSPFITSEDYDSMIIKYFEQLVEGFDSLMTVSELRSFIWNRERPINYNSIIEKWPRTQTLEPLYEVNSGAFIADQKIYHEIKDRIGKKPFFYILSHYKGFDIDWEDDFSLAEKIYYQNNKKY